MTEDTAPAWAFLTNHALVLLCIAHDPGIRLRDIGDRIGITERGAHRIVTELGAAGYIPANETDAATSTRSTRASRSPTRSPASRTSANCSRS